MAFLRVKRARGRSYAYLVENAWDASAGQSRQRVVRYLGRLDELDPRALPAAYRSAAAVRQVELLRSDGRAHREHRASALRERFVEVLLLGDSGRARAIAQESVRELGADGFSGEVLVPALHEVGRRWAEGAISVSDEHLATGVAEGVLFRTLASRRLYPEGKPEVVLCVPDGETHAFPLLLAEGFLVKRGFAPINLGASAPEESVVAFVRSRRPAAVLISVTLPQFWEKARRLGLRVHRLEPQTPVSVGGQGVPPSGREGSLAGVETIREPLESYLLRWPPRGETMSLAPNSVRRAD